MRTYTITITGQMPLLMHNDDIEWADKMDTWKANPNNRNTSKAGDDRSPAYRWIGALYHDEKYVVMPTENVMRCLMEGGAMVPTGKGQKTFKAQSQSGILVLTTGWPLLIPAPDNGGSKFAPVPFKPIAELMTVGDFSQHKERVAKMGFNLYLKRAKIGQSKHIRVRPRFEQWATSGNVTVGDDQITVSVLESILKCAGTYKGLGDWRPGSKTPGPYGTFAATVTAAER